MRPKQKQGILNIKSYGSYIHKDFGFLKEAPTEFASAISGDAFDVNTLIALYINPETHSGWKPRIKAALLLHNVEFDDYGNPIPPPPLKLVKQEKGEKDIVHLPEITNENKKMSLKLKRGHL